MLLECACAPPIALVLGAGPATLPPGVWRMTATGRQSGRAYDLAGESVFAFVEHMRVSADGGASWSKVGLPSRKMKVQDVDFVKRISGYLLTADGRVFKTTNGGRRSRESTSVGTGLGNGLSFSSADAAYVSLQFHRGRDLWRERRRAAHHRRWRDVAAAAPRE